MGIKEEFRSYRAFTAAINERDNPKGPLKVPYVVSTEIMAPFFYGGLRLIGLSPKRIEDASEKIKLEVQQERGDKR